MVLHSIFFSFDEELLLQNILVLINALKKKQGLFSVKRLNHFEDIHWHISTINLDTRLMYRL